VVRFLPPHHSGPISLPGRRRKGTQGWHFGVFTSTALTPRTASRFRAALSDGIVLSKSFDPCVWLHTTSEFEALSDRFLSPHSPFGGDARRLRRRFHGGSFDEKLDSAGRIHIPRPLIEHANLQGPCVVIGAGEYLEIWNAEAWAEQEAELDASAPEIAEGLAGSGASA
jgi:transcriptional regulator MraZ